MSHTWQDVEAEASRRNCLQHCGAGSRLDGSGIQSPQLQEPLRHRRGLCGTAGQLWRRPAFQNDHILAQRSFSDRDFFKLPPWGKKADETAIRVSAKCTLRLSINQPHSELLPRRVCQGCGSNAGNASLEWGRGRKKQGQNVVAPGRGTVLQAQRRGRSTGAPGGGGARWGGGAGRPPEDLGELHPRGDHQAAHHLAVAAPGGRVLLRLQYTGEALPARHTHPRQVGRPLRQNKLLQEAALPHISCPSVAGCSGNGKRT